MTADQGSDDVRTDEQEDLEVLDDVEWFTDDQGTEYFVHEGARYELGDDGFAYEVGPADGATSANGSAPATASPAVDSGATAALPVTEAAPSRRRARRHRGDPEGHHRGPTCREAP
jgi:hypothetical protein